MKNHWPRLMRVSLLRAFVCAWFTIGLAASAQINSGVTASDVVNAVEAGDVATLDKIFREKLYWVVDYSKPTRQDSRLASSELANKVQGCSRKFVSDQYGEMKWVCKLKPTVEDRCFDEAVVGFFRRFSDGPQGFFTRDIEWSDARCGDAPVFVPQPATKK